MSTTKSKYYKQLVYKADQFISYIAKKSIYGEVIFVKDYLIKIKITKIYESYGEIHIYYRPSRKNYTFITSKVNNTAMREYLQELWDNMNTEAVRGVLVPKYIIYINIKN